MWVDGPCEVGVNGKGSKALTVIVMLPTGLGTACETVEGKLRGRVLVRVLTIQ